MRKYRAIALMSFHNTLINRGAVVLWRVGNLISLVAMVGVWISAKSSGLMGGYSRSELIAYYFAAIFLYSFVWWTPITSIKAEINDGFLGPKFLLKPVSYFWHKFFEEIGWHMVSVVVGTLLVIIPGIILWSDIKSSFTVVNIFPAILATIFGAILCFNFTYTLGMLTFWTTEVFGISSIFWVGINLFGGHAFPISFYPEIMRKIVDLLPFRYIFSFSLEIFSGRSSGSNMFFGFLLQMLWITVFYLLSRVLWNRGLRKFSAYGG